MVGGLDRFRDHFQKHSHQYALIGGAACDLAMDEVGLAFRLTKDLDIVLVVEELDAAFAAAFWDFLRKGRYTVKQSSTGRPRLYRFEHPQTPGFPALLEIFSAKPERVSLSEGQHLAPVVLDEAASGLSAILLDDDYYAYLKAGIRKIEGVPIVGPEHLIPLKARAWLDLTERRATGEETDAKSIRKHRNDVFRLYTIIDPAPRNDTPLTIRTDMGRFLAQARAEEIDMKSLGIPQDSQDTVLDQLGRIYGVG